YQCKADSWRRHSAGPVCERVECAGAGRAGADTAFADRSRGAFAAGAEFGLDEFDRNDFRDPRRAARVVLPLWCNLQRRCGPTAMERTPIEVGSENVNDLTIVLSTPGTIKGRLRAASDATDADHLDFSK